MAMSQIDMKHNKQTKLYITILAGGVGKRMNSELPKVLHQVKGEAMIVRLLRQIIKFNPVKIIIVVGKFHQIIKEEIDKNIPFDWPIVYARQETPLGTGDAVKSTLPLFNSNETATNIILNGDVPLLQYSTIHDIYASYLTKNSHFQITSINLASPSGNGRIIRENGMFQEIVEEKDCNPEQKLITLINCGIYIFDIQVLLNYIPKIKNTNAQNEYYLTDIVKIYRDATQQVIDLYILDVNKEIEIYNVNTRQQLEYLENLGTS